MKDECRSVESAADSCPSWVHNRYPAWYLLAGFFNALSIYDNLFYNNKRAEDPFPYMRHAGVFVLSSLWEGLPNCLVHALASDARVVSTDCSGGPDKILESGKRGSLVPVSSPELLAEAMIETFINWSFRDKHAAKDRG